jgi:hypothetical protein
MKRRTFLHTTGVAGLLTALGHPAWAAPADSRYVKILCASTATYSSTVIPGCGGG